MNAKFNAKGFHSCGLHQGMDCKEQHFCDDMMIVNLQDRARSLLKASMETLNLFHNLCKHTALLKDCTCITCSNNYKAILKLKELTEGIK